MARADRSQILAPALLSAGLALLVLAWVFGNPPGAGPDEGAHYIRALGAGNLELTGKRNVPTEAERRAFEAKGREGPDPDAGQVNALAILWLGQLTRTYGVPAELSRTSFGCNAGRPEQSAACLGAPPPARRAERVPTYTGTYPPWPYVVPGAAMRATHTPSAAVRTGRLVSAAIALMFLGLALVALWPAPAGLLVAVTPMVVFSVSILNASAPEIAGAICLVAAALRLQRGDVRRWVWAALAAGGAAVALSRALGPVFVVTLLGLVGVAGGLPRRSTRALVAGGVIAVACGLGAAWELTQQPLGIEGGPAYADALSQSFRKLAGVVPQAIGNFGALDTALPRPLYALYYVALAGLLAGSAALGSMRQRAAVLAALGVSVLATLAISTFQLRTGFDIQGRYVLPLLVVLPLLAGEILWRRRPLAHGPLIAAAASLFAGGQFLAWWVNARRAAVGTDGPWWFFGSAEWSPPGGWWVWALVAATGCALALAGGLAARRSTAAG